MVAEASQSASESQVRSACQLDAIEADYQDGVEVGTQKQETLERDRGQAQQRERGDQTRERGRWLPHAVSGCDLRAEQQREHHDLEREPGQQRSKSPSS